MYTFIVTYNEREFKKYKIFVAASTHATEEIIAAKTHLLLKKKNKRYNKYKRPKNKRNNQKRKKQSCQFHTLNLGHKCMSKKM